MDYSFSARTDARRKLFNLFSRFGDVYRRWSCFGQVSLVLLHPDCRWLTTAPLSVEKHCGKTQIPIFSTLAGTPGKLRSNFTPTSAVRRQRSQTSFNGCIALLSPTKAHLPDSRDPPKIMNSRISYKAHIDRSRNEPCLPLSHFSLSVGRANNRRLKTLTK